MYLFESNIMVAGTMELANNAVANYGKCVCSPPGTYYLRIIALFAVSVLAPRSCIYIYPSNSNKVGPTNGRS